MPADNNPATIGGSGTVTPENLVIPPPTPHILDFPAATTVVIATLACVTLLMISTRFDQTHGTLTISLLVVLTFIGVTAFCVLFTIPRDETTSAIIGGLVTAFGGVIGYWLSKPRG
jgi:hypothetical protein